MSDEKRKNKSYRSLKKAGHKGGRGDVNAPRRKKLKGDQVGDGHGDHLMMAHISI